LTCSDLDLDLDLDLWPFEPKLARQLLLPRVTFAPTPVFLRFFVFPLRARTEQTNRRKTNRRTDGRTDKTRNAAY